MRSAPTLWPWRAACVGLAGAWIGLGWLGALDPASAVVLWARVLTVYDVAFFTLIPLALHLVRRGRDRGDGPG